MLCNRMSHPRASRAFGPTLALVVVLAGGCTIAPTLAFQRPFDFEQERTAHVLLMRADIELSEMTASGMLEPKAEWTQSARENVTAALERLMQERGARLLFYQTPDNVDLYRRYSQLMKLHAAVGRTIRLHKPAQGMSILPTMKDRFDWSLGSEARALQEGYGADFALFVFIRQSYPSAGRVAVALVGALLQTPVPTGGQTGFASLVDLRTGNIVWFTQQISPIGDVRTSEVAVERLLNEFPL